MYVSIKVIMVNTVLGTKNVQSLFSMKDDINTTEEHAKNTTIIERNIFLT